MLCCQQGHALSTTWLQVLDYKEGYGEVFFPEPLRENRAPTLTHTLAN